jgi:hypothetical protein
MLKDADKSLLKALGPAVAKASQVLKAEADARTPEDTTRLVRSTKLTQLSVSGDKVSGGIENATSYATYVEYGVGRAYNYHKPKGVVFRRGVGARMFTLAFDAKRQEVTKTITEAIRAWASDLRK